MNKLITVPTILLVLVITATAIGGTAVIWSIHQVTHPLAAAGRTLSSQVEQLVNPTPTVKPDPVTIVKEMRNLNRLETAAYTMEKIITAESRQGPLAFLLGDRLILVAHGQVIAGIDLSQLDESSVTVTEDGSVNVTLPPAEILVTALSSEESYVFDRRTGVIGQRADLETEARRAAETTIRDAALQDGILRMAQRNAETSIRHFILRLGFENVQVTH